MNNINDIATSLVKGFGLPYFFVALPMLIILGALWLAMRGAIKTSFKRRLILSLFIAITFAPSIFGFDLGVITFPAFFIIVATMTGSLRFIAAFWSCVSIIGTWAILQGAWGFIVYCRGQKQHNTAAEDGSSCKSSKP